MTPSGTYVRTEEQKKKIAQALRGTPKSIESRKRMSLAHQKLTPSLDTKNKIQYTQRMKKIVQGLGISPALEEQVRPQTLADFVGNDAIKKEIALMLEASRKTGKALNHALIAGIPGSGKTSLARIIAHEMGPRTKVIETHASLVKTQNDVKNLLVQLSKTGYNDEGKQVGSTDQNIIILDEAHALKKPELIYSVLEDFVFLYKTYEPYSGEEITKKFKVPAFTLLACTNLWGELPAALIERCPVILHLDSYSEQDMVEIGRRFAEKQQIPLQPEALKKIALSSKLVPRIVVALISRINTIRVAQGHPWIDRPLVNYCFDLFGILAGGLTKQDVEILKFLYRITPRKVGIERLAAMVGESKKSFLNYIAPFLEKKDYIRVAPAGRFLGKEGLLCLKQLKLTKKEVEEIGFL